MTDYDRHARLLFGPYPSNEREVASVLGSHGFRFVDSTDPRDDLVVDAVTHEPIALLCWSEARELAAWLELERPLPARGHRVPGLVEWTAALIECGEYTPEEQGA